MTALHIDMLEDQDERDIVELGSVWYETTPELTWEHITVQGADWHDFEDASEAECLLQDACELLTGDLYALDSNEIANGLIEAHYATQIMFSRPPLAQWYLNAERELHRRKVIASLKNMDRLKKYGSSAVPTPYLYSMPLDAVEDIDEELRALSEVTIHHGRLGENVGLDEVLEGMTGFDIVTDPDMPPGTPTREIRRLRTIVDNAAARKRADEVCSFTWSDEWAAKDDRYKRGRISQGPLLNWGGETWNVCTAQSLSGGKYRYTVFVRTHVGTDTITRKGKSVSHWTWEYHRYQIFDRKDEALRFQHYLSQLFRNERDANDEHWQFSGSREEQPFDPAVLSRIAEPVVGADGEDREPAAV